MKNKFSFVLLTLLPVLSILVTPSIRIINPKIYWTYHVFLLLVILFEEKVVLKSKVYFFLLLGIPILWAALFSLQDNVYLIIQTLFYLTTPLIFTFLGMQISRIANQELVFKYLIFSGTLGALLYIILSFYFFGFGVLIDPYEMRDFLTWGSITNVLALIIVLYSKKFDIDLFKSKILRNIIAIINFVALYLTASRTYYITFIIFLFVFSYKDNKKITFLLGALFSFMFVVILSLNSNSALIYKIQSVSTETSMGEYDTEAEINTKYRGFETYMALKTYLSGTPLNLIFGHGLEKQVDLKVEVKLGDSYRSVIPVLHNGYAYMLIKEGFLGLIFYLVFFVKLVRYRSKSVDYNFLHMLVIGSVLSLVFSNFVVGTFFSIEMSILWVFFGVYIKSVEKSMNLSKESKLVSS